MPQGAKSGPLAPVSYLHRLGITIGAPVIVAQEMALPVIRPPELPGPDTFPCRHEAGQEIPAS